jgi:hypothetical protein
MSSANRAFGVFKESKDAGEYIYNKKSRATYCVANNCSPSIKVSSQSNKLLFNNSNKLSLYPCLNHINPANLNINLITRLNLNRALVIKDISNNVIPSTINTTSIPYLTYEIDPSGNLFGDSVCGIDNFKRFLRPRINLPGYIVISGSYEVSSDSFYNTIITFTNNSTMILYLQKEIHYLVVGGGGGGGSGFIGSNGGGGGGGGGGGVINSTALFTPDLYTIDIGIGGAGENVSTPAMPGSNGFSSSLISSLLNINAVGGYGGQANVDGGASGTPGSIGGIHYGGSGTIGGAGAGAGYTQSGGNGSVNISTNYGTTYGPGGGGGGGGSGSSTGGFGGNSNAGKGGNSFTNAGNGVINTGGGGGGGSEGANGSSFVSGGNGGSGVIILSFNA